MDIQHRTITLEEYHAICDLPENADKILELIDGEIVEKMPSFSPSKTSMRIGRFIGNFVDDKDLGYVTGEAGGYVMPVSGNVYNPDVGYISKARLSEEPEREAPLPPDLAVEVKSPTDSKRAMRRKAEKYLENGTQIVWLVFPDEREIEVYSLSDEDVRTVGIDGILDGASVLPGFTLPVANIFRD